MRTQSERPRASSNPDIDVVAIIHSAGRTHALPQLAKRLVFSGGWLGIRSLMPLSLLPTGDRIVGAHRGAVGSMRWAFFLIARRVRSRRLFRVAVPVTSFLLLNEVLRTTDLIAIVPRRLLTGVDGLTMMKPPIDIQVSTRSPFGTSARIMTPGINGPGNCCSSAARKWSRSRRRVSLPL